MNDNVVKLRPDNKQDLIDMAEKLLAETKEGKHAAIVILTISNQVTTLIYNAQTHADAETLLGLTMRLQHMILKKMEPEN